MKSLIAAVFVVLALFFGLGALDYVGRYFISPSPSETVLQQEAGGVAASAFGLLAVACLLVALICVGLELISRQDKIEDHLKAIRYASMKRLEDERAAHPERNAVSPLSTRYFEAPVDQVTDKKTGGRSDQPDAHPLQRTTFGNSGRSSLSARLGDLSSPTERSRKNPSGRDKLFKGDWG